MLILEVCVSSGREELTHQVDVAAGCGNEKSAAPAAVGRRCIPRHASREHQSHAGEVVLPRNHQQHALLLRGNGGGSCEQKR
jgi:hypothetical protein